MTTADNYHSNPDTLKNNIITSNGLLCCFSCIEQTPVWNTLFVHTINSTHLCCPQLPPLARCYCREAPPGQARPPSSPTATTSSSSSPMLVPRIRRSLHCDCSPASPDPFPHHPFCFLILFVSSLTCFLMDVVACQSEGKGETQFDQ